MYQHRRIYIFFTARNLFSIVLISYSYLFQYVLFLTLHKLFVSSPYFSLCFCFILVHSRETQANLICEEPLEAKAVTTSKLVPATEADEIAQCLMLSFQYIQG